MSRGDWVSATVFGLAVAALFGWGFHRASELQREYSEDRQEIASKHSDRVENSLRICGDIPSPLRAAECRSEAISAAYGEESAQKDLKAQQHMSVWAFGMFIATLAALLVTLAGLVFVVRTWRETKRTADIAKEMGERQIRAYLDVEILSITYQDQRMPRIDFRIRNLGQTPATNIVLKTRARYEWSRSPIVKEDCTRIRDISGGNEVKLDGNMVLLQIPYDTISKDAAGYRQAKFFVGVFATDVFDKPIEAVRMFRKEGLTDGEVYTMAEDRWGEATSEKFGAMQYRPGPKAGDIVLSFNVIAGDD